MLHTPAKISRPRQRQGPTSASATVVDDLAHGWGQRGAADHRRPRHGGGLVVRTCNGLLCLCDNKKPGGEISPANPATGETLGIPPVPVSYLGTHGYSSWNKGAQLRVHPGDGAVRDPAPPVPRRAGDLTGGFNALQVFMLAEASWREARVRAQDARRGEVRSVRIGESSSP